MYYTIFIFRVIPPYIKVFSTWGKTTLTEKQFSGSRFCFFDETDSNGRAIISITVPRLIEDDFLKKLDENYSEESFSNEIKREKYSGQEFIY